MPTQYLWLIPLGLVVGAFGTLIGAGGGFVLVPALLLAYPKDSPETITSITLAVVFFNALSGSWMYARMRRIDYRLGCVFSVAAMPGAVLGALSTAYVPRRLFDAIFGIFMLAVAILLTLRPRERIADHLTQPRIKVYMAARRSPRYLLLGAGLSTIIGWLSTLLGVGAGFIYVPAFIYLLDFPVHFATATSQFILAITAFTGSVTHLLGGFFHHGLRRTVVLAVGVILGAQIGARLSQRIHGVWIMRGLAVALGFVGMRILLAAFFS